MLCGNTVRLQPNQQHLLDVRTVGLYREEFLRLQKQGRIRFFTTSLQPFVLRAEGGFSANPKAYPKPITDFERPPELRGEVRFSHLPEHKNGHYVPLSGWQMRHPIEEEMPAAVPLGGGNLPPEIEEPAPADPSPGRDLPPEVQGSYGEEDDFGELLDRPVGRPPVPPELLSDDSESEEGPEAPEEKPAAPPPAEVRGRKKKRR